MSQCVWPGRAASLAAGAQRPVPVRIAQAAAEQRVELSRQVVDGDQEAFGVDCRPNGPSAGR